MKILVPTDFSSNSEIAISTALDITSHLSEDITFLHLMNLPKFFLQLSESERKIQHPEINSMFLMAEEELKSLVENCTARGIKSDYFIGSSGNKEDIYNIANDKFYDLIVMSSLFSDGDKNKPAGYWIKEVIRYTTVPVLATKTEVKSQIKNVALLSDFSNEYRTNEEWINDFIIKMNAQLFLCCVNTPSMFFDYRTMKKRIDNFKKDFAFDTQEVIYNDYQFDTGIKHMSEDLGLDLIIMNTHGKKGMDHYGRGGITEQVVERLDTPILCLPLLDMQKAESI